MSTKIADRPPMDRRSRARVDHSGEDRRVINVSLSALGKAAYSKVVDKKRKVAENMLSKLNDRDQAAIIKHLAQLADVIKSVK